MTPGFSVPYNKFLVNGNPAFELSGEAKIMTVNLDGISDLLVEDSVILTLPLKSQSFSLHFPKPIAFRRLNASTWGISMPHR
jgi:hypothetical protein